MKILYAIQGTGNGHICRAREIVPHLQNYGTVDVLISGTQVDIGIDHPISYRHHGFSFFFGKHGGVNHWQTYKSMNLCQLARDIRTLPVKNYNLIINDFEPITAWACKLQGVESVSLSHQAAFRSHKTPKPNTIDWGELILKHYAPATHHLGFHFKKYDEFIHTPVIRSEIRALQPTNSDHYTVYLPAIDDTHLYTILKQFKEIRWEVFSKHSKLSYRDENIFVQPVNNEAFNASLASCEGLFTGGGFEGPSEALFLGKKLLIAPMKYQYEQQCNAVALKQLGIPVIWASTKNWYPIIKDWIEKPQNNLVEFPDETASIIEKVVSTYSKKNIKNDKAF